jgi:hypothetical protein
MQSKTKTHDFIAEIEAYDIEEDHPRSFKLYEEYSQRTIAYTIKKRRENLEKTRIATKNQLSEVEKEIKTFQTWLEESKNLDPTIAYYIAISLKSLLLGLPTGLQVAQLFSTVLDKQNRK